MEEEEEERFSAVAESLKMAMMYFLVAGWYCSL